METQREDIMVGERTISLHRYADGAGELPDLSGEDWRDGGEAWTNGCDSLYRMPVGDGVWLYVHAPDGEPEGAEISRASVAGILGSWDHDCDEAEWLALWGLDGLDILTEADPERDGPCRIWCEPQYYQGTYGAPCPGYARDDAGDILDFDSYADAAAHVEEYYEAPSGYDGIPACNVLAHGQAGADTLTIVQAD